MSVTVEQWLGENNKIGIDIWHKKYQYNNESFDEWLDRVSARDQELRKLIVEKKFLMGGRTLANRGTDSTGSLFNCYSRGYVEDDYSDIMDAAKDIGVTFKAQGGQGISLTKLRPKGTPIKKEYFSDGIVPFMKIFNVERYRPRITYKAIFTSCTSYLRDLTLQRGNCARKGQVRRAKLG